MDNNYDTPHNFSEVFRRILKDTGINNEKETTEFLFPEISHFSDPFLIPGMEESCECLADAIFKKKKIFVYADGDIDGISGACILTGLLSRIEAAFDVRLTHRLEEYDIDRDFVEQIRKLGYELLIIIDTGTNSQEVLACCEKMGLSIIIIDHHLSLEKHNSPDIRLINPNVTGTDIPHLANLTAAGLVFKFIQALKGYLSFFPEGHLHKSIELAMLGTLSDYGVLSGENRSIVKLGLKSLQNPLTEGLKSFRQYFYMGRETDEIKSVTFYINPKLNTPGRFGKPEISFKLLTAFNQDECFDILSEIEQLEKQKQKILKKILSGISDVPLTKNPFVLFEDIPVSFSGLIASRLAEQTASPALAAIKTRDFIQGSARSFGRADLFSFFSGNKDLFMSFGGHRNAVGFKTGHKKLNELQQYWKTIKTQKKKPVQQKICDISLDNLTIDLIREFQLLKPFGQGNPEVLFRTDGVKLTGMCKQEKKKSVVWVRHNGQLFEAHFNENMKDLLNKEISIVFSPKIKKAGKDLYITWLDVKSYSTK